ncbi:MAG: hypothetical protein M1829_002623 [Trizodia sp. TS-e1964]|nr:MAG: hypothetical protein M1829_002623 [Trizodia sp. TS-e1964]
MRSTMLFVPFIGVALSQTVSYPSSTSSYYYPSSSNASSSYTSSYTSASYPTSSSSSSSSTGSISYDPFYPSVSTRSFSAITPVAAPSPSTIPPPLFVVGANTTLVAYTIAASQYLNSQGNPSASGASDYNSTYVTGASVSAYTSVIVAAASATGGSSSSYSPVSSASTNSSSSTTATTTTTGSAVAQQTANGAGHVAGSIVALLAAGAVAVAAL